MKFKAFSIITLLLLFVGYQCSAQLGFDLTTITKDNIFQELFSPVMSALVVVLGIVSKYIPTLKDINKATLTFITSVVLGVIAVSYYKMPVEKAVLSVLFAVMAYNNLIKQVVTKPIVKED